MQFVALIYSTEGTDDVDQATGADNLVTTTLSEGFSDDFCPHAQTRHNMSPNMTSFRISSGLHHLQQISIPPLVQ